MERLFTVIYESLDLLVINKSADLVCHPTKDDLYSSLVGRLRLYVEPQADVHLINRLDREMVIYHSIESATSSARLVSRNEKVASLLFHTPSLLDVIT